MTTDSLPVYSLEHCSYAYRSEPCLNNICCTLQADTFYGLIGPNGSGKTTLLNLLTGATQPSSGSVLFHQAQLNVYRKTELARMLSMVPQKFSLQFDYTVSEVVLMGRHPYISRFATPSRHDTDCVINALKTLDIYHLKDRFVTRLSGGEQQRVLVARALAQDTGVMVLDEATANLDVRHSIDIMNVLRQKIEKQGGTIIAAIHDLDLAASFCDELIILNDGELHDHGPIKEVLNSRMLQDVFRVEAEVIDHANTLPHIRYRYTHEQA